MEALGLVILIALLCVPAVDARDLSGQYGGFVVVEGACPAGPRLAGYSSRCGHALGGGIRRGISPHWSAALGFRSISIDDGFEFKPLALTAHYILYPDSAWTPVLIAGGGIASAGQRGAFDRAVVQMGSGMEYFPRAGVSLSFNIMWHCVDRGPLDPRQAQALTCGAALTFFTGRTSRSDSRPAGYVSPPDSDNDGIPDPIDSSPGTPAGVPVDEKGRPVFDVTADEDADGVPDYLDACLQTPRGVPVDASGCPVKVGADDAERQVIVPAALPAVDALSEQAGTDRPDGR